jgi:hypothetical protein
VTSEHARKQAIRARMAATGEPYSVAARALAADLALAPAAPGDPAALAEVIACVGRTLAAASARLVIQADTDIDRDPEPDLDPRPGLAGRLAGRVVRRLLGPAAADISVAELRERVLHQYGAGFIEPAAGRFLVDFGGYAEMLVDGRRYGGLSGQPVGPRHEQRPHRNRRDDPLDALRKLQRATEARWAGTERVRETTCRVAATRVNDEEFTVWLDDQRVQRFRTVHHGSGRSGRATTTETTELWSYGAPVDDLDWTRLPAFRTPADGDAAGSAG